MSAQAARNILGVDKESELLQSFVGLHKEEEEDEAKKLVPQQSKQDLHLTKQMSDTKSESSEKQMKKYRMSHGIENPILKKRKHKEYYDEVYCDKDRAAAVSIGSYDIKQSMILKRRQDRSEALQLPEEAEPGAILNFGIKEIKNGNLENAVLFITKALEMNATDSNALISRSKCYLSLGEPAKALEDAETALLTDKNNIRAIFQKAESLYYLGQFEHSLMFFHRGLRLRPELGSFRLGVQKTQEAIENTIGGVPHKDKKKNMKKSTNTFNSNNNSHNNKIQLTTLKLKDLKIKPNKADADKKNSRRLLGELCVDKEYLENLLKHPNYTDTSGYAKDAINFLNNRQEFWRQQKPSSGGLKSNRIVSSTPTPKN